MLLAVVLSVVAAVRCIELTFELPDNERQCFYEEIKEGVENVLEYQVVTGGQYDVDMTLEDDAGKVLYKGVKKQYDSYTWKPERSGTAKACFSNEFSTFTHKVVYMDWQKEDEDVLKVASRMDTVTRLDTSASTIGDKLRLVDDYQTHHRLREATGRKRAEDLSERVMYWSLGQTFVIIVIGIAQVMLLRSFFTEKRGTY